MIELYDEVFAVNAMGKLDELEIRLLAALDEVRDAIAARNVADWPEVDDRPHLYAVPA